MKHIAEEFLNDLTKVHNIMINRLTDYVKEHGTITFNGVKYIEDDEEEYESNKWDCEIGYTIGSFIIFPIQLYIKDDVLMLKYKEQELDEGGYIRLADERFDKCDYQEMKQLIELLPID